MEEITVIKRDGREVPFDRERITNAIRKCFAATNQDHYPEAFDVLTERVCDELWLLSPHSSTSSPISIETIQDAVENVLLRHDYHEAAKAYILYRAEKTRLRSQRPVPEHVKAAFDDAARYFPTPLQQFQFFDKYSRFNYELGRRETWIETVDRAVAFMYELAGDRLPSETYQQIKQAILEMKVMPSMRLLAMAGPAARRNHIAIYNCSALPVDSFDAFVEALFISMSGCGVGFSVERRFTDQLPHVNPFSQSSAKARFLVEDTSEGWAEALRFGLDCWSNGVLVDFDYSQIRPAGALLRTKGGRASGPDALRQTLTFFENKFVEVAGRGGRIRPLDAHDMMCMVGHAAVSGGSRRTAMLSLFDLDDQEMLQAKSGNFDNEHWYRWNANNSAVWEEKLDQQAVAEFVMNMVTSKRGEPGIFNRKSANSLKPDRRKSYDFLTNPCSEILLKSAQFCNLSSVICRPDDDFASLREKIKIATIVGTIQSLATSFPLLRDDWRKNCEEERLLGVDLNGQQDCTYLREHPSSFSYLLETAYEKNKQIAEDLNINQSAAITCVKPNGNSSQLVNSSSGLHARWAPYYVRNVRVSAHTPVFKVLRDAGVPMDPENGQERATATTWVIHFPVKAPDGALTRNDMNLHQQLSWWMKNKLLWTEHNASCTITYTRNEVADLIQWIWTYQDIIGGLSFLPKDDANYAQMPYVEITQEAYEKLVLEFPSIDFSKIYRYEEQDHTQAAQEVACSAGGYCEL